MSEEDRKDNTVIPYCVLQYKNYFTNTFRGMIVESKKVPGEQRFVCQIPDALPTGWKVAGTFYAASPHFRPLPAGMKIFCAKMSDSAPYGTTNVTLVYDMFREEKSCVYFTTYNQPVIGTKPLYFHRIAGNVFPSFEKNPPTQATGWSDTMISPVFVIDPAFETFSFGVRNGICLPMAGGDGMTLDECVSKYNKSLEFEEENEVLNIVDNMSYNDQGFALKNIVQHTPWYVSVILAIMFAAVIAITLWHLASGKSERRPLI